MKESDIFGTKRGKEYINVSGQRIDMTLSKECRIYKYEKKIGTYIDVYFDHVDKEQLKKNMRWESCKEEKCWQLPLRKFLMYLEFEAYNFEHFSSFYLEYNQKD